MWVPTLQKALQAPGFVNHQNTLQVQGYALNFNGEILVEDWQDSSSQIGCLKLWLFASYFQLLCTPAILSKSVKLLLISYLRGETAGSESASVVCFHWTTFSARAGQVQIAAGLIHFTEEHGRPLLSTFLRGKSARFCYTGSGHWFCKLTTLFSSMSEISKGRKPQP